MSELSRWTPAFALSLSLACQGAQTGEDSGSGSSVESETSAESETSDAEPDYEVELLDRECPFEIPSERSAECYTLRVPLDRDAPAQGVVELPIAVLHPAGAALREPVLNLHGGPGGRSFIHGANWFARALSQDGDLILFDQRGSGDALPNLDCPELEGGWFASFTATLAPEAELELMAEAVEACRDRLAAETDLDAYDTPTSARDVEDLRRALGIERWNLYGTSYGSRLALEIMRQAGERVDAAVLDSAYPPQLGDVEWMERGALEALPRLIEGCLAEASCGAQFPGLSQNLADAIVALDAEPYAAAAEDSMGGTHELLLTGADMYAGLYNALYDPELIPNVPLLIAIAGIGGNFNFLDLLAEQALPSLIREAEGARFSIDCADTGRLVDAQELSLSLAAHPELTTAYMGYAVPFCALWGVEPVPAAFNEPVVSDVPALVLAGEFDSVTPSWQGELTVETLSAGELLVFPGQGHAPSFRNECAAQIVRGFFVDQAVLDYSCFDEQPETTFP